MRWLFASTVTFLAVFGVKTALCAEDVVTLGATVSLTGKYALNGVNTKNGYDLAIRQINDKGGVKIGGKSYKLDLRYYDDESTPARSTELVERLIQQDGVNFMLGPYSSGLTKAILPIIERHKVPMVEANGAARELFTKGYRYIFAVLSTSDQYLRPAWSLQRPMPASSASQPARSRSRATANDPFAQDVRAGVLDDAMRLGINCVIDDQLPPELDDMSVTLNKVKALKPDLLVVSGHEKGALTAVKQIEALRTGIPMVALTHCDSARLAEQLPKAASHVFCAHQWHRSLGHKGKLFGSADDFARRFQEVYGYEAPYQSAQSAVAVYVFADAMARAQDLDIEKVRDALAATDLATFYGPIKFDDTGKNVAKPMVLTQIIDREYVVVAPEEWAVRDPVIPRPGH
ncbi:amino acid ABC transporter substrate-binding protein [Methyloceanibacter marginalis]|uniref:Amino acid ABC transporter substrate-binding protein n=1 Tax=Methyloceanibacter marginalis TaxID=1774971 RepID=A0A1E3VJU0_9HYPH|nr:amino acid ABC transporter substrate-binding protein [Methyloceanibacter marginalis]ODR93773.1 amino acid ABC transporter substrate-binding protein [Methyloceanibacter marginalis]